jgi:hypothetical protein
MTAALVPVVDDQTAPLDLDTSLNLMRKLDSRRLTRAAGMDVLAAAYEGRHQEPVLPPDVEYQFNELRRLAHSPWMRLVVDAAAERLRVDGFRTSADRDADQVAWSWWQRNRLDAGSALVHIEAIKLGLAYVSVMPTDTPWPRIRGEHPCQTYVEYDPDEPGVALYGIKTWTGADGYGYSTLYTPDYLYRYVTVRPDPTYSTTPGTRPVLGPWQPRTTRGLWPVPNSMGCVPIVPFYNCPTLDGGYASDIAPVLPIQDRIDQTLFARIVAGEYGAFRQKWVTGLVVPKNPDGSPRKPEHLDVSQDRLLIGEDPDTQFGEFGATDLGNYIAAIEADTQHIASISRTPAHYILGHSGQFPSGESLKATETGLMARVYSKQIHFGEAWEDVIRLAGRAVGDDERAGDQEAEVIWANTESRTMAELADSLLKEKSTIDTPPVMLAERLGYTPTQIDRMVKLWEEQPDELTRIANTVRAATTTPPASQLITV